MSRRTRSEKLRLEVKVYHRIVMEGGGQPEGKNRERLAPLPVKVPRGGTGGVRPRWLAVRISCVPALPAEKGERHPPRASRSPAGTTSLRRDRRVRAGKMRRKDPCSTQRVTRVASSPARTDACHPGGGFCRDDSGSYTEPPELTEVLLGEIVLDASSSWLRVGPRHSCAQHLTSLHENLCALRDPCERPDPQCWLSPTGHAPGENPHRCRLSAARSRLNHHST